MRKEDKGSIIENLAAVLEEYNHFYIADVGGLDAVSTSQLRRQCFKNEVKVMVVKNTLLKRALDQCEGEYDSLYETLKGSTSLMLCNTGNVPAKLIKEFRKKSEKPILKAAFVEESVYVGDDQLDTLSNIKSKDELIGDVIALLQSPAKNVISALQSGGSIIHGVLKTLGERE